MKHKGGYIYGSIYERKDRKKSYTAEIRFQGRSIRRTSEDKAKLRVWIDNVCEEINGLLDCYNDKLASEIRDIKKRLYSEMLEQSKPILAKAKQYDLRYIECAAKKSIMKSDNYQTYLIRNNSNGLIKIGKSKDIFIRMRVLRVDAKDIDLIAYTNDDIETKLHKEYKSQRKIGEWFDLNTKQVDAIISQYNFMRL